MRCKNCGEPIADFGDEGSSEEEWAHTRTPQTWRCRDDSGNHAEPKED